MSRGSATQLRRCARSSRRSAVAVGLGLALSGVAFSQQKPAKEQIVGAWTLVSVTGEMDDGKKGEPFGPSPKGMIVFSNDGHFSLFQARAEIPKVAANDRAKATLRTAWKRAAP